MRIMARRTLQFLLLTLINFTFLPAAGAANPTMTDTVVVNSAKDSGGSFGFNLNGTQGSVSPFVTSNGYAYVKIWNMFNPRGGGFANSQVYVSGFSSDPGESWLVSVKVGSTTQTPNRYTYNAGVGEWTFLSEFPLVVGGATTVTVVHGGQQGYLNLKYQVLGVDYAPPGANSSVNYGSSAMQGTSKSNTATFISSVSETVDASVGGKYTWGNMPGVSASGAITESTTNTYTTEQDDSTSVSIATTTSNSDVVKGPLSSAAGIDHNYDVIWVWLNPVAAISLGANRLAFNGYLFNEADPAKEMDIVPLYVIWLKNPSTIPAPVANTLARSWDTSGLGGLTTADYTAILKVDPFASGSFNPNTDSGHRYDLQAGYTFNYEPPPAGGQPITETYQVSTQTTSSAGQTAQTTYSTTSSNEYSASASFFASLSLDFKTANTWTTIDKWSTSINSMAGKTAALTITGPAASDHYTGPTLIQVWRDNIYGSFMFYPVQ